MKYTVCILLYCTLFLVNSVHSLLGGNAAALGAFPSHALVLVNNQPRGGTIVNVNHIVTSCRNVLNNENHLLAATAFTIRVGSLALGEGGFTSPIIAVFPHPEFNPWTFQNDVAVLRTTNNMPFTPLLPNPTVAPAVFNERIVPDLAACIVVGFNAAGVGAQGLQQLGQPILNRDTGCNAEANHNGRVLESMFCAGVLTAASGICPTTIGGGIYCNGNFTGIATDGNPECGLVNSPSIYTQVRHHIQWITEQYTRGQIPQPGATPPPGVSAGILSTVASSLLISVAFLLSKL